MNFHNSTVEAVLVELGQRMRRARLAANLTQQALADTAGVSLKTVRNAEDGQNISLETLVRLLRGIGRADEFESFLAPPGPSPIELVERRGQQRQRARGRRKRGEATAGSWQW